MAYDLTRLASYVRFYMTVQKQLDTAWQNLASSHAVVKDALSPFAGPLTKTGLPALTEAMGAPPSAAELAGALFRPEDEASLSGLTDVYEVVGRFTFQGDGNENLARIQALVSTARNEIVSQRMRLADLAKLPDAGRAVAARLANDEATKTGTLRGEKSAGFEPLADQVAQRARQTMDAVRGVAIPDLSNADSAADDYKRFVAKLDQVYQTCLPFLRKSIVALYAYAGAEPTATWPDTLPLVRELPAELVTVPPEDSPELSQASANLGALGDEEIQLGRARDDVANAIARLEGELAAAASADKDLEAQIATATRIVDFAAAGEAAERASASIANLEQQKADLLRAAGQVWQRHKQIEARIRLLDEESARAGAEAASVAAALEAEKKDEPVLFGKDEWRARVAGFEAQAEALKAAQAQRIGVVGGLKIDLSRVSVEVQTEQQQALLIDRQLSDVRATLEAIGRTQRELAAALGAERPARPVPADEAREGLGMLQKARSDNTQRADRLRGEIRRQKDETTRILTRMKQVGVERQQVGARVQSAQVAATEGHEGALKHLADQRRSAVERHVSEVVGTLEKSLAMVGPVFIEPARKVMIDATESATPESVAVRESADGVAPVIEKLARELDPELLSQDAGLGQIQREFCDVAAGACRAAWS